MSEGPYPPNEGQPEGDQARPEVQKKKDAARARDAYNRRAQEKKEKARSKEAARGKKTESKSARRPYTGPDPIGDLYDMATPPPKIGEGQAELERVGDLSKDIDKRKPPSELTKLRDPKPSALPEEREKPNATDGTEKTPLHDKARRRDAGESPAEAGERRKMSDLKDAVKVGVGKDKPSREAVKKWFNGLREDDRKALLGYDMIFPPEVIRRSDAKISPEEAAERRKIAQSKDGIGFGFGKDKPTKEAVDRWYKGLSDADRKALHDPDTIIDITGFASRPGEFGYNLDLSIRRAKAVANILVEEYGIDPSRIRADGLGELAPYDPSPDVPDNKDDHRDRVVMIDIETKESPKGGGKPGADAADDSAKREVKPEADAAGDAAEAGRVAGDKGEPPEGPEKYTPADGMRDGAKDVLANLLGESVGAAKTVVDYAIKFFGAVGETHEAHRKAATARGVQFSLAIMDSDVRYPDNPHVTEGKPYTGEELDKRIRDNGALNSQIQRDMPYLRIENSEAPKQFRNGMEVVARSINSVLRKARTPEQRRRVIDAFVKEGTKRISKAYLRQAERGRR